MRVLNYVTQTICVVAMILLTFMVGAQEERPNAQSRKDKIEQLKIAFITKELNLSSEEAEKFWPVYNEMNDDLKAKKKIRKQKSNAIRKNYETMSESELEKQTLEVMDLEISEVQAKKKHMSKIADIVGYKKAVKLLTVEQRFKKELLNKVNSRPRGQAQGNRPRGQGPNRAQR